MQNHMPNLGGSIWNYVLDLDGTILKCLPHLGGTKQNSSWNNASLALFQEEGRGLNGHF